MLQMDVLTFSTSVKEKFLLAAPKLYFDMLTLCWLCFSVVGHRVTNAYTKAYLSKLLPLNVYNFKLLDGSQIACRIFPV